MSSGILDLESQLLSLAKRRVEIETQWIEVFEKLLAARSSTHGAKKEGKMILRSAVNLEN